MAGYTVVYKTVFDGQGTKVANTFDSYDTAKSFVDGLNILGIDSEMVASGPLNKRMAFLQLEQIRQELKEAAWTEEEVMEYELERLFK